MSKKYCPHCWPTKRRNHFIFHLNYYIDSIITFFKKSQQIFERKNKHSGATTIRALINILSFLKIIRFADDPNVTKLYNRSLIFFNEAKKRGLDIKTIKFLWFYVDEFRLIYKNKKYYYNAIPITIFPNDINYNYHDKFFTKKLLKEHGIPVSSGQVFTDTKKALRFGQTLGFPLVVKPSKASLSHHVTCLINSDAELSAAIQIARKYRPAFIVEKYIHGNLFRATVIDKNVVFICQKDKANIQGNGYSTIEELIKTKNNHINRGHTHQMNTTLHKIPIDNTLIKNLTDHGLNLKTILEKDKKIYLQNKYILSYGCDIIGCSEDAHVDNKKLFIKIANILETNLVGIDFICPDINKSYKEQETAILECNDLPYIDMHQYPSHGKPEPVAEIVWDAVLNRLK